MSPRALTRLLLCLAACAVGAVAAGGCGSSSSIDPVAQAAQTTQVAGGSKMAIKADVSSPGLSGPISIGGEGFFNYKTKEGQFDMTMQGLPASAGVPSGGQMKIGERIKSTTVFVESDLFAGKLPGGARWVKLDLAKFGATYGLDLQQLTGGESNFGQLLDYLKASAGGAKQVGHATVRGVATTRYRGTIDLEKVVDQAPASARAQLRNELQAAIQKTGIRFVPVEIWVDSSGKLRRFELSLAVSQSGQRVSTQVSVELFDFGATPAVVAPAAGETYDVTQAALGQQSG